MLSVIFSGYIVFLFGVIVYYCGLFYVPAIKIGSFNLDVMGFAYALMLIGLISTMYATYLLIYG